MLPPDATPRLALWAEREPDAVARGARQRAVLDALRSGPLPLAALRAATGAGADVVRRLAEAGALRVYEPSPPAELEVGTGRRADGRARPRRSPASPRRWTAAEPLLLHGVTGRRQDGGLPARDRALPGGRSRRHRAGAGDRARAADGRSHHGPLRRSRGGAALGAGAGRARGRAPAHPARRGARGGRPALGDLRAARRDRADRRRRGARRRLQAGVRPALRRAGGGAAAGARARRGRRLRHGHAARRVLARPGARVPAGARRRPAAAGHGRRPLPRRRLPALAAGQRRPGGDRARRRARRPAAQPPRRGAGAALPRLRLDLHLRRLRRRADAARAPAAAGVPPLRAPAARAAALPRLRRRRRDAARRRHRAAGGGCSRSASRPSRCCASTPT